MKFYNDNAHVHLRDDKRSFSDQLQQTTHLGIGAHQDDLEIMASHGIMNCLQQDGFSFSGIVCTDGAGSARPLNQLNMSDEEMSQRRSQEQVAAAKEGGYASMIQLGYKSKDIKHQMNFSLVDDIKKVIEAAKPAFIYTHNLGDKHDTHIAVAMATIKALRDLNYFPSFFYGCEVWRSLDWLGDHQKVPLEIKGDIGRVKRLIQNHKTQVNEAKPYDLAVEGRMKANATFFDSQSLDNAAHVWFAMDLKPLLEDHGLSPVQFLGRYIEDFKEDVTGLISRFCDDRES